MVILKVKKNRVSPSLTFFEKPQGGIKLNPHSRSRVRLRLSKISSSKSPTYIHRYLNKQLQIENVNREFS